MSIGSFVFYDSFAVEHATATIDLGADSFVCIPLASSYAPNVATHTRVSNLTGEVTTNGGQRVTLANKTWTDIGGGIGQFDADNVVWTQSGASDLAIRYYAIADNTPVGDINKPLVGYGLLDITPADVIAPAGGIPANNITLNFHVNGIFRLTMTDA